MRLTECELAMTNSLAFEQVAAWLAQALQRAGRSFSPDGRNLTITAMLPRFLRDAGFHHIRHEAFAVNFSAGTEEHQSFCQDFTLGTRLMLPFLLHAGVTTEELFQQVYQQMQAEMAADSFCAIWYYLRVSGTKAENRMISPAKGS